MADEPAAMADELDATERDREIMAQAAEGSAYHVLDDPVVYAVILIGVLLTTALPVFLGQRFCLPLLSALVIFPLFVWAVRLGRPRRAIALAGFWAICQAAAMLIASLLLAQQAGLAIFNGLEMRSEVMSWIASGQAAQGSVAGVPLSLPKLLTQALVVAGGSLLTAGLAGLIVDALALNATSYIAVSLAQMASQPVLTLLLAWPIWTMVRLAGYFVAGAALAEPLAFGDLSLQGWAAWWRRRRRLLAIGAGLVLLGILLQLVLGPAWTSLLRQTLGW